MKTGELTQKISDLLIEFGESNDCLITDIDIDIEAIETSLVTRGIFRIKRMSLEWI